MDIDNKNNKKYSLLNKKISSEDKINYEDNNMFN
jgi:hypothetical protein